MLERLPKTILDGNLRKPLPPFLNIDQFSVRFRTDTCHTPCHLVHFRFSTAEIGRHTPTAENPALQIFYEDLQMNNTNTLINLKTLCTTLACLAPPLICAQPAAPLGGDPGNPSQLPTNRDLLPSRITNSPNSPLEFLNERNSNQDSASQRAIGRYTYRITRTDPNKNRDSFFGWELPAGFDRVDLRLFTP